MSVRQILKYPEAAHILKSRSEPVRLGDPGLGQVIEDLKDTLLATENGVGLAAPQIGVLKRIFVLRKEMIRKDLPKDSAVLKPKGEIAVFMNPKIIARKGSIVFGEGCLSVPDRAADIERAKTVKIRALDETGMPFYEKMGGLAAIAVQQEIDHLDGILIIDHPAR
ncbi:MAG: peptide deformylase [Candidatus Omnitrophica bacterium]|nr:peptide deformylase [Candidatus Omnitrophota bacterium]